MPLLTRTTVTPYLMLNGRAKEAMEFYHRALGGELTLRTYGEAPGLECPAAMRDQIMHADLRSGDFHLMASDTRPGTPVQPSAGVHLAIGAPDAELARLFEALSAAGEVEMPLADAPWGGKFGSLIDRYGFHWMFASNHG